MSPAAKKHQEAQEELNAFQQKHQEILQKHALLITALMEATRAANKELLAEALKTTSDD